MQRVIIPVLGAFLAASFAGAGVSTVSADDSDTQATTTRKDGCKVVERKGASNPSGVSSSVTAGGGKVSADSTGDNTMTVHSGNGSTSTATTGSASGGTTVVTGSGSGDCTIYVDPDKK